MKSLIKQFYNNNFLFNIRKKLAFKPFYKKLTDRKGRYYIWRRDSIITDFFLGHRVLVYNGRKFQSFVVRPSMIGYKFGEFSFTRRVGEGIHPEPKGGSSILKSNKLRNKPKSFNKDQLLSIQKKVQRRKLMRKQARKKILR